MEMLNCKKNKAIDTIKELDIDNGIGLIEKKRQGQGKPTIIYVKNFMMEGQKRFRSRKNKLLKQKKQMWITFQRLEIQTSRGLKIQLQEVLKINLKRFAKGTLIILRLIILSIVILI